MFNMDFSGVTQYLDEVQRALQAVKGNLGQVKINNVTDPQDVQRALGEMEHIVDRALAPYMSNPTVVELARGMKASYREQMLRQVEANKQRIGQPKSDWRG